MEHAASSEPRRDRRTLEYAVLLRCAGEALRQSWARTRHGQVGRWQFGRRAIGRTRKPTSDILKRLLSARQSIVVKRHDMSGPSLDVMQGEVGVLEPTVAVHDTGTLPLEDPAQRSHGTRVRDCRVERACGIRVKGPSAAAPSADTDDAYTIKGLLGRIVTGLERHDRHRMAEVDQLAGKGFHVPFKAADDRSIKVSQLKNVHKRLPGWNGPIRLWRVGEERSRGDNRSAESE